MPISSAFAESNRTQTERLRRIVRTLDADRLAVRLPNGWTVAGTLAHVAFWDRQRLCLMSRWAAGEEASGAYDGDVFNAALQPILEMIPHERAAAAALARPDAPNLDRGSHREGHLDRIEQALAQAG